MKVLAKSIFVIDNNEDVFTHVEVSTTDLDEYITSTIEYVTTHKSTKRCKPRGDNTEVIACSRDILSHVIKQNHSDLDNKILDDKFNEIARRLFSSEKKVQAALNKTLGNILRKGSFIQSLVYDDINDKYLMIFIKVNHTLYLNGQKFKKEDGILLNKKDWRSCQFNINTDDKNDIKFESADVYLDTNAKYWIDDFLELDETTTDEKNTQNAFRFIDSILNRNLRKTYPYDYTHIRNAFVYSFRREGLISYEELVSDILDKYTPCDCDKEKIKSIKMKLLPENKENSFDYQFNIIPTAVKARIKKEYHIQHGIELKIDDGIENLDKIITACEDPTGEKYLKIRVENDDTFNAFYKPNKKSKI